MVVTMMSKTRGGLVALLHPGWKDWYHLKHRDRATAQGAAFEDYVEGILIRFHDDYFNPTPAGSLGDGGCDGLAESGTILYACYGSRAKKDTERKLRDKLAGDFARGLNSWSSFTTWRFITNAPAGPECARQLTILQQSHSPMSQRPLTIRLWNPEKLWVDILSGFSSDDLNEIFPGAPGLANVELEDLVPLLDALQGATPPESGVKIRPVPLGKMEFNDLPEASRIELNSGRTLAPRIDAWYEASASPDLHEQHAEQFRLIYDEAKAAVSAPGEILERIYVSVGGGDFRLDGVRANAVYAVAAYFFDECHIFEAPPPGYLSRGVADAVAEQGREQ